MAKGVQITTPIADLLGLAGYLPIHPRTYMRAWRNRCKTVEESVVKESMSQK